ncbi:CST complex subunit CTC1 isoform X2 [Scleropages formosus]|uniref:CST complex subunit CTC1 isoform X2 n=1 Tax=Scleropages formosus TaxID=113540 RepID=UPI000877F9BC|nr:CST complex subunit CTC1 isoform X2 [Scleropages formosus]
MDSFLREFKDKNRAELLWLRALYQCVVGLVGPEPSPPAEHRVLLLALGAVRALRQTLGSHCDALPLSYRPVSVCELVRRQLVPCCSQLTWSNSQYCEWAADAERLQPEDVALPRENLLLVGYITDREIETSECDGILRAKDANASVNCMMISPSPMWLDQFVLFPSWSFIPHRSCGLIQDMKGHLEIGASPIPLVLQGASQNLQGTFTDLLGVGEAARYLQQSHRHRGVRLHVCGHVSAVCPLLEIAGKRLFCFSLREGENSVPVVVPDSGHVCWELFLHVGDRVCISGLRVCALRAWHSHRVLCVTPESHLRTPQTPQETHSAGIETCVQLETYTGPRCAEEYLQTRSRARSKTSRIISYKGVLTRVLDAEGGLFELDGKVGLCVAYQPLQEMACSFRPGAQIELHNAHFLHRPSPHGPAALLCLCLRSSLRVTAFSRVQSKPLACPSPTTALLRVLLQNHLGISQYLWLCHCVTMLKERLCPRWIRAERVAVVAGRVLSCLLPPDPHSWQCRRDIYMEMLEEPHSCPLSQYRESDPQVDLLSVEQLRLWMEAESWASLSLPSLLPPSAPHLTRAELNPLLSWSVDTRGAWSLPIPLVVVGVLGACVRRGCLQLRDQTGSVDLVAVERRGGSYGAVSDTAWLGRLVCVQHLTLVMEKFLNTDFPSWTQLDQDLITHRHCRVYIQLCVDDLQVLSPWSGTMSFRDALQQEAGAAGNQGTSRDRKGMGGNSAGKSDREQPEEPTTTGARQQDRKERARQEEDETPAPAKKPRRADDWSHLEQEEDWSSEAGGQEQDHSLPRAQRSHVQVQQRSDTTAPSACVSLAFCVESKDGLTSQNIHAAAAETGHSVCFRMSIVVLGDVQRWKENPRNCPLESRESAGGALPKMDVQFVGSSVCWFPLLHPGSAYRLVAPHTQDPTLLCGTPVSVKQGVVLHSAPSLLIQPHWRFYTLPPSPRLSGLLQEARPRKHAILSVSEVLYCSTLLDLVSFEGLISQRTHLQQKGRTAGHPQNHGPKGLPVSVRLTVQDLSSPGQWIHVYLDLSERLYIPGLLPGARVLFSAFQCVVSRVRNVYCRSVPLSCITVNALGQVHCRQDPPGPRPPTVLLGEWVQDGAQRCIVGQVRVHIVVLLFLQLQWTCSLCGSIFKQDSCTRSTSSCTSHSAVFQAEAKAAVEDGSGEAHVWFPSHLTAPLLALGAAEWEGLQRSVRVRGHVRVHRGRNVVDAADLDDPLLHYLSCLCMCAAVCRPLTLSCQLKHRSQKALHLQDAE